ncbi:MAG: ATP-binding protein [Blastocatellia bacterium]|nr:ATP-binding protein [Blastocatellia bacterium]
MQRNDKKEIFKSNSSRSSRRKTGAARRDGLKAPGPFEEIALEKPERAGLDGILSFVEERIALRIPSDLKYLDSVLDYLNERLLKLGIVSPESSEVLIALDEAIVNAIKHGNKCNPRKAVHIVAELSSDGARFTITDEGPGFAANEVPDPTEPSRLLKPSGRGLLLINHIMDEVCYNKCGNQIQMFKRADVERLRSCQSSPSETESS